MRGSVVKRGNIYSIVVELDRDRSEVAFRVPH